MLGHISLGVAHIDRSRVFYDAVLGALGIQRTWTGERGLGYGPPGQERLNLFQKEPARDMAVGLGFHLAFDAADRDGVDRFYAAAIANGGGCNGKPGLRPNYGESYYAAFVLDPDGHRLEAVHQRPHDDRPLRRGYSRIERERRFLLSKLPPAVDPNDFQRLCDCFVKDTHLRLRHVLSPSGDVIIAKLGQKIVDPLAPWDVRRREMTTIYLDAEEAAALPLTGLRTTKRRYKIAEQGWTFCIDVWEEPENAMGIILAEVECQTDDELDAIRIPEWADREVTDEPEYSAIHLAQRG